MGERPCDTLPLGHDWQGDGSGYLYCTRCGAENTQPAAGPTGEGRADEVREQVSAELARHGDTMSRGWSDNDAEPVTVLLGCRCGHERGTVTAQELAADLDGFLRQHREHVADAVLAVPAIREALALRQRVEELAEQWADMARDHDEQGANYTATVYRAHSRHLRRALAGRDGDR